MSARSDPVLEEEEDVHEEEHDGPTHHPTAPLDEFFDVKTTVDPSYIISLIRKLLPSGSSHGDYSGVSEAPNQEVTNDNKEGSADSSLKDEHFISPKNNSQTMDIDHSGEFSHHQGEYEDPCNELEQTAVSVGEDAWEEYGCILWDLAASKTHAELMVENLILEVLLANLMVCRSPRVTEISVGIIGNLACHEVPMKHIVSTNGLIEIIVDKLFLDDPQCLCETFRYGAFSAQSILFKFGILDDGISLDFSMECLDYFDWLLTVGLQSGESITWTEALQSEHLLSRILWVAENTLNLQLIEKSIGLILAILEGQQKVVNALLPPMMNLGLASLLISHLDFEMSKLMSEKIPERYSVLDLILHAIEALSIIDDHSQQICSSQELFQLVCDLVKFPDKVEVANCCVTAAVLIANILSDIADRASEISHDLSFLEGLLDIFPFASDDLEARNALWNIIARILFKIQGSEMSPSSLYLYVKVFVSRTDLIEDELLNQQSDDSRITSLRRIIGILNQWTAAKNLVETDVISEVFVNDKDVKRLLNCCQKYSK